MDENALTTPAPGGMNGGTHITPEEVGVVPQDPSAAWTALGVSQEQYAKYYNADTQSYDWKSHAVEAEYKLKQGTPKTSETPTVPAVEPQADLDTGAAEEAAQKAGVDFDAMTTALAETGNIDASDRDKLNKIGIPNEIIDQYIAGVESSVVAQLSTIMHELGGEAGLAEYKALVDRAGWTQDQRTAIEQELGSPNWQAAVTKLKALKGGTPVEQGESPTPEGFASQNDLTIAIQDPKYRLRGPLGDQYRRQVMEKASRSSFSMNPRSHTVGF